MQNNSKINTILLVIVIILLAIGIWALLSKKQNARVDNYNFPTASDINSKGTVRDSIPETNQASRPVASAPTTAPSRSPVTYANSQFKFEVKLPAGNTVVSNIMGNGDTSIYVTNDQGVRSSDPSIKYLATILIGGPHCEGPSQPMTINSVEFLRKTGEGYNGGMASNSYDAYYCTTQNDKGYTFIFSLNYARSGTIDASAALAEFDREMKLLNFKFTN